MGLSVSGQSDVRLTYVDLGSTEVTLTNMGNMSQNVSTYWLCNFPAYMMISTLFISSGDLELSPGESVTVIFTPTSGANGEVGLYTSNTFSSSAAMLDYFQWGSSGHTRESVAVAAGVWDLAGFLTGSGPFGNSAGQGEYGSSFWAASVEAVRILSVSTDYSSVELTNMGTLAQDISSWQLCRFPVYSPISALSVLNDIGSDLILNPGETVLIQWSEISGPTGELGLYNAATFGLFAAMEDYMEWGSGGHFRESVAIAAGYWGLDEFVSGDSPYLFLGGPADFGVEFWLENIPGCTYADADNFDPLANVDDGSCTFTVGGTCPGDFNDDNLINTTDLLAFLGVFGTVCP